MRKIVLWVGLIAVIGIGVFILRPFLSGSAGELKVGDCFDVPAVTETVEDVQHHPCNEAHGGEVFFVSEHAAGDDAPYPPSAELSTEVETACLPQFETYTGLTFETDPTWTFGYFYPLADGWAGGDRIFICYATRIDDAPTNTSIKKA